MSLPMLSLAANTNKRVQIRFMLVNSRVEVYYDAPVSIAVPSGSASSALSESGTTVSAERALVELNNVTVHIRWSSIRTCCGLPLVSIIAMESHSREEIF
jgi:hypothetical protein